MGDHENAYDDHDHEQSYHCCRRIEFGNQESHRRACAIAHLMMERRERPDSPPPNRRPPRARTRRPRLRPPGNRRPPRARTRRPRPRRHHRRPARRDAYGEDLRMLCLWQLPQPKNGQRTRPTVRLPCSWLPPSKPCHRRWRRWKYQCQSQHQTSNWQQPRRRPRSSTTWSWRQTSRRRTNRHAGLDGHERVPLLLCHPT